MEQRIGEKQSTYRNENRNPQIQDQGPGYHGFHLFFIFRPESSSKQDSVAAVDAVGKADDQTGDGTGKTDGCQRRLSKVVAGDHRVTDVVALLKKIADKKWDRKDQNIRQGTSLSHITGLSLFDRTHVIKPPFYVPLSAYVFILFSSQDAVKQKNICNCSEPSRFSCKSVSHACMNEHFYREIYLADTPHRRNA